MPATELKIGTFVLIPNFNTQKEISKKLQPLRKKPYQITAKPTEVTYKLTDLTKKEIVQHRNKLLPYHPKDYALRELTQLYSFTGLKNVQINTQIEQNTTVHDDIHHEQNQQQNATHQNTKEPKLSQKERKNRKMIEKILLPEQKEKSVHRESSRLRNQPRKNYKTFILQSKILKKLNFKNNFNFQIKNLFSFHSF